MSKSLYFLAFLSAFCLASCMSNDLSRDEWRALEKHCREESRKDLNPLTNNAYEYEECMKEGLGQPGTLGDVHERVQE